MTMRDYKLICPVYSMLLKGKPCQRCAKGKYYQCLINKCSKDSYHKSFLNTADNVRFLGYISGDALHAEVASSLACVLPSECYENNPRTIIEAFCLARPVIGARIGGIPELVKDGQTGLTFEPGNVADLRSKIITAISNPGRMADMGNNAKHFAQENLNPDKHYEQLIRIYQDAMTG